MAAQHCVSVTMEKSFHQTDGDDRTKHLFSVRAGIPVRNAIETMGAYLDTIEQMTIKAAADSHEMYACAELAAACHAICTAIEGGNLEFGDGSRPAPATPSDLDEIVSPFRRAYGLVDSIRATLRAAADVLPPDSNETAQLLNAVRAQLQQQEQAFNDLDCELEALHRRQGLAYSSVPKS